MTQRLGSFTKLAGLALAMFLGAGEAAWAGPYSVLLESNADRTSSVKSISPTTPLTPIC
jgi:hypothetical protein